MAAASDVRCVYKARVLGFDGARQAVRTIEVWIGAGVWLYERVPDFGWSDGLVTMDYLGWRYRLPVDTSAPAIRVDLRDDRRAEATLAPIFATATPIWAREC